MSTHVMIDIETMGTGNNAALLSIGATKFDPIIRGVFDSFYAAIDLSSAMAAGGVVTASTIEWWLDAERQEAWARYKNEEKFDVFTALDAFVDWYGPESLPTWGNGATFDNVIVRSSMERVAVTPPWKFWDDRCYRTVKNSAPGVKLERKGTHHNALDDAISQTEHLQDIVQYLQERKSFVI